MSKRIEILVDAEGNVNLDALGYSGPGCEAALREIEQALGTPTARTKKREYYTKRTEATQRARAR
jgi:hypothetical protein